VHSQIRGDGNCYFRAISFIITGVESNTLIVRDRVVRHMESAAIASKLEGYLNNNISDYLNSSCMDRDSVCARDAEIISTVNLLGCDIMCSVKWAKGAISSTGKDFLHSSLSASLLMIASTCREQQFGWPLQRYFECTVITDGVKSNIFMATLNWYCFYRKWETHNDF